MRLALKQAIVGLAALAALSAGPAMAQDAGATYTRAVDMIESDPKTAWALLKPLADSGHAPSMAAVGSLLSNGAGVVQDLAAGRDWYRRAAEAGSVTGIRAYGGMLLQGEGGPKDAALGIEDQAEQRVLWDMSACLERILVEPFDGNYQQLVSDARAAVRDED